MSRAPGEIVDATSFHGNFSHSLDDKGRISLPAPFRQVLKNLDYNSVVLTNYISDGARCLEGFSAPVWKAFEAKLREKSRFDPRIQKLENFYLARATQCSVDSNGRINIPQHLRSYAGLTKDVVFTATLNGFRVWDARVWDLIFSEAEQALLETPELFADLDL